MKLLSKHLIQENFDLVYGGGITGLMGVVAEEFLKAGKEVIGVRPEKLIKDEAVKDNLSKLIVVKDMYDRKSKMVELSDLFIALPGGVGTLDEIIEVFTLLKIGFINKPCGIFDPDNYYNGLQVLLDRMVEDGFLSNEDMSLLKICDDPKELLFKMKGN